MGILVALYFFEVDLTARKKRGSIFLRGYAASRETMVW